MVVCDEEKKRNGKGSEVGEWVFYMEEQQEFSGCVSTIAMRVGIDLAWNQHVASCVECCLQLRAHTLSVFSD